eukprot:m.355113 g.355113  ORF g.355113 m.355113 type:complete len:112 (-) comp16597_c1_seq20:3057-3392(-)
MPLTGRKCDARTVKKIDTAHFISILVDKRYITSAAARCSLPDMTYGPYHVHLRRGTTRSLGRAFSEAAILLHDGVPTDFLGQRQAKSHCIPPLALVSPNPPSLEPFVAFRN